MKVIKLIKYIFVGAVGLQLLLINYYWPIYISEDGTVGNEQVFFTNYMVANLIVLFISMFLGFTDQGKEMILKKSIKVFSKKDIAHISKSLVMSIPVTLVLLWILQEAFYGMNSSYWKVFLDSSLFSINFYSTMVIIYPIMSMIFNKWNIKFY